MALAIRKSVFDTISDVDCLKQNVRDVYYSELMDDSLRERATKVAWYAYVLARFSGFSEQHSQYILQGSLLHDIGKSRIPDSIENKPGKLTPAEYDVMKTHCVEGLMVLHKNDVIPEWNDSSSFYNNIILCHHERFDGTGYPIGLSQSSVPLEANVVSMADVFDALSSERVYKPAWAINDVLAYINQNSGLMFYPELVDTFAKISHVIVGMKHHFDEKGVPIMDPFIQHHAAVRVFREVVNNEAVSG